MTIVNKCEVFLNNNEIVIYDSTGFYSAANPGGWSHPLMNGSSPVTACVIDSSLNPTIESITLIIDNVTIEITSSSNTSILPTSLEYVASPKDLIFTLNQYTYSNFYADFGSFTDGVHEIEYTINFTLASGYTAATYSTEVFTYKEVEAKVWDIFHSIAYNHNSGGVDKVYLEKALYAYALYKGLEYSSRTSTNQTKSLEILATLTKVVDFKNSLSI